MGICLKLLGLGAVLSAIGIGVFWHKLNEAPDVPDIPLGYWGPGSPKPDNTAVVPFTINISEADVADFVARLDNTRFPVEPLEGIGFQYGFNSNYLKKLIQFWQKEYKWSEQQKFLNKYPQFKTQIAGLNIHFIHVKPDAAKAKGKQVVPLLLIHGWPGSVREFYEAIELLKADSGVPNVVYEIVVPSLPGYGWSDPPRRPGHGPAHMANVFTELMIRLGHEKFIVQGGDWGSLIGAMIAALHPENTIAYHSNMCTGLGKMGQLHMLIGHIFPSLIVDEHMVTRYPGEFFNLLEESGYFHIQATKPDTVGVGLTDSPAGLAAYILEKFSTWTNRSWRNLKDGGLENWDKKRLLDNIMIYWFSKSITTSMRLYSEAFSTKYRNYHLDDPRVNCPLFFNEFSCISMRLPFNNFNLAGGHFAAFEVTKTFTDDLKSFIKTLLARKKPKEE
ncbi:unnamed protein product [Nesidiocoris tenuis]|uniref:Epoxide hydrolase n=1 Tax=Nesidiocoris tenuis TaxID=355587 RepID=A0A6H5H8N0_9HEMI|nr:unnamed protein product [Nesidiocoris tenuis]